MAGCELNIIDISVNPDCPENGDRVMFTGTDGLTQMREWAKIKQCLNNGLIQRADIKWKIGDGGANTPPAGSNQYLNIELAGKRYRVFRRGVGYLQEGTEFQVLEEGGFKLLIENDVFGDGEVFHIQEYETLTAATDGGFLQGVVTIGIDTVLTKEQANSLFDIAGGNNRVRITLPELASVNPFTMWAFSTDSINAYQQTIFAGAAGILFRGKVRQAIYLAQFEYVILIAGLDRWYVYSSSTGYERVGQPYFDYIRRGSSFISDGTLVSRIDFPRVTEFILENPTVAVTDEVWKSHPVLQRQLFSLGDGVTTIRLPDLRGLHFRALDRGRGLDEDTPAGSLSGRYQGDMVGKHNHESEEFSDRGWPRQSGDRTDRYYFIHRDRDGGNLRRLQISEGGGVETRGKNVGLLGLINV